MRKVPCFNALIENVVITNRDTEVLTDYWGTIFQDHNVAYNKKNMRIMFEHSGNRLGGKIAFCDHNSAMRPCGLWATAATLSLALVPKYDEAFPLPDFMVHNRNFINSP